MARRDVDHMADDRRRRRAVTALRPLVDVFFFVTYVSLGGGLPGLDYGVPATGAWEPAATWNPMLRRRRPAVSVVNALVPPAQSERNTRPTLYQIRIVAFLVTRFDIGRKLGDSVVDHRYEIGGFALESTTSYWTTSTGRPSSTSHPSVRRRKY